MNPRHFSTRTLLGVTTVVCLWAALAAVFRESRYLRAFLSPHIILAALPIIGIFAFPKLRKIRRSWMKSVSLAAYLLAMPMPALGLGGDVVFGFLAFMLSFYGIALFTEWGPSGEGFWYPIACTMGAVANICFIVGYLCIVSYAMTGKGLNASRKYASLGSCLALLVVFPLALSTELNWISIGYGLWAASFLVLAFGTWSIKMNEGLISSRE